jgi:hypothetical protein
LKKQLGGEGADAVNLKIVLRAESKIRVKLAYIYADLHLYNTGRVQMEEA